MALDPTTIQQERAKIEQIKVTGTVQKSNLIEHTECIDTYSSSVDTGTEQIDFNYAVLSGDCTTNSINDILLQPFAENANVKMSLTEAGPHSMISGSVLFTSAPSQPQSFPTGYVLTGAASLVIGIIIGFVLFKIIKK